MRIGTGFGVDTRVPTMPFSGIIDAYPAAMAFSLRKLSSSAVLCCRVRRSSDNNELDIGFAYNPALGGWWLDEAALLAHCGGGDGFLSILYDQSGAARNMAQSNASAQYRVANAGVIERQGSTPVIHTIGSGRQMYQSSDLGVFSAVSGYAAFWVGRITASTSVGQAVFLDYTPAGTTRFQITSNGSSTATRQWELNARDNIGTNRTARHPVGGAQVWSQNTSGAKFATATKAGYCYTDGSLVQQSSAFTGVSTVSGNSSTDMAFVTGSNNAMVFGEFIFYNTESWFYDRASIEANQKAAWGTP